jgi:hypothetical protein
VTSETFSIVSVKIITVFCDVTSCNLVDLYSCFLEPRDQVRMFLQKDNVGVADYMASVPKKQNPLACITLHFMAEQ